MTDILNAVGLIASIASLALAIIAIWLSIVFYRLSRDESERSARNANEIGQSVSRLEKVFDGLYSDTFAMMKETVTDMRRHIWREPENSAGERPEEQAEDAFLKKVDERLDELATQLGITTDKATKLKEGLEPVVRESVEFADDSPATLRELIESYLRIRWQRRVRKPTVSELGRFAEADKVATALFELRRQGHATWDGEENVLRSDNVVSYIPPHRRTTETTPDGT